MRGLRLGLGLSHSVGAAAATPAYQQILDLATADGWTAVYDVTNPDTRTTRESGGSTFISAVADGLGNFPDFVQATESAQFELLSGQYGQLDGMQSATGRKMDQASNSNITQPFHYISVATLAATGETRVLHSTVGSVEVQFRALNSSVWAWLTGGTERSGGTTNTNPHVFSMRGNGASSYVRVDGSQIIAADSGSGGATKLRWGAHPSVSIDWLGQIGLWIIKSGAAPTDAERDAMEDLVHDLTGIAKA